MKEKRKRHFNVGEVKTQILEYILQHDTPVKEPELTEHLKNEYSEFNRASVNRHLWDLASMECVTKITPEKKSRFNYWDIKLENLKSIKEKFPDISLNEYKKAYSLVFSDLGMLMPDFEDFKYYIKSVLSKSFINTCIEKDLNTLRLNASKAYCLDKNETCLQNNKDFDRSVSDFLIDHFIHNDIILGVATQEEIEFNKKYNPNLSQFSGNDPLNKKEIDKREYYLKIATKVLVKYNHPIFGKTYNNSDELENVLKEKYVRSLAADRINESQAKNE